MHRCNHRPSLIMGSIMAIMGAALCATMSIGHIGFIRTAAAHEAAYLQHCRRYALEAAV